MGINTKDSKIIAAYINCWILSETVEQAEETAKQTITELKWEILNLEEATRVSRNYYKGNPTGLSFYEQALIDKEVYQIHTYESQSD